MKSDRPLTADWNTSYLAGLRGAEVARQHAKTLKSRAEKRRYRAALLAQMHSLPKLGNGPDYRGWTPLTPQEAGIKTASVKARALEGLLGGVLGGGLAGAGRAVFWEPKEPREWADQYGNIYDRPLTVEEKKARRQAISRAMLAGALGGAGASLGASALAGKRIAKVEREAAQEAAQDLLEPFRKLIGEYKTEAARMADKATPDAFNARKRVRVAEKLYKQQEQAAEQMVDKAMGRRAQLPFRGKLHPADSGAIDWRQLSAAHLVNEHFDGVAKKHGFGPVFSQVPRTPRDVASAEATAGRVFDRMVSHAMSKTAAQAFWEELEKIAAKRDPNKFAGLKVLPLSREDRGTLNRRLKEAGLPAGCVSLKKTEKGYCVHTHRARCSWYPSVQAIPLAKLKFIESTG